MQMRVERLKRHNTKKTFIIGAYAKNCSKRYNSRSPDSKRNLGGRAKKKNIVGKKWEKLEIEHTSCPSELHGRADKTLPPRLQVNGNCSDKSNFSHMLQWWKFLGIVWNIWIWNNKKILLNICTHWRFKGNPSLEI